MQVDYVIEYGHRKGDFPEDNLVVSRKHRNTLEGAKEWVRCMRVNPSVILIWWRITKRTIEEEVVAENVYL